MPTKGLFYHWLLRLAAGIVCVVFLFSAGGSTAVAQELSGLADGFSPLVFLPRLQGEMKGRLTWAQVVNGNQNIPDLGIGWDLRDTFNLTNGHFYVDYMLRVQLSRLSAAQL